MIHRHSLLEEAHKNGQNTVLNTGFYDIKLVDYTFYIFV